RSLHLQSSCKITWVSLSCECSRMWSFFLLCLTVCFTPGDDWVGFHGVTHAGSRDDVKLPDQWSTTQNVAWKLDIPGLAWSSPVTWKGRIFITSVVRDGEQEKAAEAKK